MVVNKYSRTPLYAQIYEIIRDRAENGYYRVEDPVLSENALVKEFDVSRMTAKRAIDELSRAGLVTRERGRGTKVNPSRKTTDFLMFEGMAEAARKRGQWLTNRVLLHQPHQGLPGDGLEEVLPRVPETAWFRLRRVRCIDDVPAMLDDIWVDEELAPGIWEGDFKASSLKRTLEEEYDAPFEHAHQVLEIVRGDGEQTQLLRIAEGHPLLFAKRAIYARSTERPIMVAMCHFRSDLFRFNLEVDLRDKGPVGTP